MKKIQIIDLIKMRPDERKKYQDIDLIFEQVVDSKFRCSYVPLLYSESKGYNPQSFHFLVIDFSNNSKNTPEVKAIKLQQNELINRDIDFKDCCLLRTSKTRTVRKSQET